MASAKNSNTSKNNPRKTGSGKKVSGSGKNAGSNAKNQKEVYKSSESRNEIILLVVLGISLLMLLSVFNLAGVVGRGISYVLFGIFGKISYILPFILFFGAVFLVTNRDHPALKTKTLGAAVFLLGVMAFIQLVDGIEANATIGSLFTDSATYKTGGGFFGGIIAFFLRKFLGNIASVILVIIIMMIGLVLLVGKAIFSPIVKKGSGYAKEKAVKTSEKRAEAHARKKAEREENRRIKELEADRRKAARERRLEEREFKDMEIISKERKEEIINGSKAQELSEELPGIDKETDIITDTTSKESASGKKKSIRDKGIKTPEFLMPKEPEDKGEELLIPGLEKEEKPEAKVSYDDDIRDLEDEAESGDQELEISDNTEDADYKLPPTSLLTAPQKGKGEGPENAEEKKRILQMTLDSFGVDAEVTDYIQGPTVTRFEIHPQMGVKVSKIQNLQDDIKLNLAVSDVRIEAPIPGKAAVGIEVPNNDNSGVTLRELLESEAFTREKSKIAFAVGKNLSGESIMADIAKMPHLIIAGATGSGKSVCINSLILSILFRAKPSEVKLIMVDPKVVELNVYNGIPHLLMPVVTDPKKAAATLNYAVGEMMKRYNTFAAIGAKDITSYNKKYEEENKKNEKLRQEAMERGEEPELPVYEKMPQLVIIIDELADLMLVAQHEVEDAIMRLAQLARAAGIHLVVATQRPSADIITGTIKANIPSRIAFAVASGVDSRVILDMQGAEKLLGKGDMLFYPTGYPKPARLQGAFVSEQEVQDVVDFIKDQCDVVYDESIAIAIDRGVSSNSAQATGEEYDVYFEKAGEFIITEDKGSIGKLQRVFKIGFNRAARIMDQLTEAGVVGPEEGTKPRKVLMTMEEFREFVENNL